MKVWSCLIWAKKERRDENWCKQPVTLPCTEKESASKAILKAKIQLLLEKEPVYTYFVCVQVNQKLRNRQQLCF